MSHPDAAPAGQVSVLEVDPGLGAELDARDLSLALPGLRAATIRADRGGWTPPPQATGAFGLLVVDGAVGRGVVLTGVAYFEVLAPGDLVRVQPPPDGSSFAPIEMEWWAVETATIAVLDERLAVAALHWSRVVPALMARAVRQTQSSAMHGAITSLAEVRVLLHVLLWNLAGRLGRMHADGVVVPVDLTRSRLARLVRARRPSVTLALGDLREQSLVIRRDDGTWLLRDRPPAELAVGAHGHDARPVEWPGHAPDGPRCARMPFAAHEHIPRHVALDHEGARPPRGSTSGSGSCHAPAASRTSGARAE